MNLWSTLLELDSIYESDNKYKLTEWKLMPANQQGQQQTTQVSTTSQPAQTASVSTATGTAANSAGSFTGPNCKPIVTIVSDKGRLRAMGTDGTNPYAFVAFPNNLRNKEGQQYEVDQLIWNGKNYRVSGNIAEI